MQEWVRLPTIGRILGRRSRLLVAELHVVFGMLDDPVGRQCFERRQDFAAALFAPGFSEKASNFFAAWIEHRVGQARSSVVRWLTPAAGGSTPPAGASGH